MPDSSQRIEIRSGEYADSVTLMQLSALVARTHGVTNAQVAMATELNLDVLRGMGFAVPPALSPNDLVIAIAADSEEALAVGVAAANDALAARQRGGSGASTSEEVPPRTVGSAIRRSRANLALVSVPGEHAVTEAFDAIDAGASVMLFSDNVSIESEVALKDAAAGAGVLVMGPDCGTASIGGVALGFANVVRPGKVGVVAASGTGAQQVMCLLDQAGVGISHCLGLGGRDLGEAVGGRSARQSLAALDADPETELILLVSKPPAPSVANSLRTYADSLATPVRWATLGAGRPDLSASVEVALDALGVTHPTWRSWPAAAEDGPVPGAIRGLFCGGTLADEAMLILGAALTDPVRSNIPFDPELALPSDLRAPGHLVIDFGDDRLTQGRAHPMIDPSLRLERIVAEGNDPATGVLLLDLVLGYGAHPDPVPELVAAIETARSSATAAGRELAVVVALIGTDGDPQGLRACAEALQAAGASVFVSNAAAARHALTLIGAADAPRAGTHAEAGRDGALKGETAAATDTVPDLLRAEPIVATAGVGLFAEALRTQAVQVTEADWQPPMPGTAADVARVLGDPRRVAANRLAFERMTAAAAVLTDVRPASEALGLERGTFLHAGPPLTWDRASGPMRGALIGAMLFEGLAESADDAEAKLVAGEGITLEPCHHRDAVGPMAGVISPSMWVYELRDEVHGHTSWSSLNEGLGKVLRYGAYGPEVIDRLHWMNTVLGPLLQQAVRASGGIDIKAIIAQMLHMGDEGHNRNRAGSLMLLRELLPHLINADAPAAQIAEAVRFSGANEHFFLNLGMPACKLATLAAHGIPGSSIVTTMARNGTDFGIRVSGTGERWFTGPANTPEGLFLGDYGPADANPDIGDSAITETAGIGGFAMAAAPAIVKFVGGDVPFALRATRTMYEITQGAHPMFQVPILDFRGTPTGIDVTAVVRTGILPQINTGMAGRVAGTGQVGAGLVTPPEQCFPAALAALAAAR